MIVFPPLQEHDASMADACAAHVEVRIFFCIFYISDDDVHAHILFPFEGSNHALFFPIQEPTSGRAQPGDAVIADATPIAMEQVRMY